MVARQKALYFQQASDHRKKLELKVVEAATIREKYLEQLSTLVRDVNAMRRKCADDCILESFILLNLLREATLNFGDAVETWHFDFTRIIRPQLFGTDYLMNMLAKQDILTTLRTRKLFKFQFSSGNILLLPIHYSPKTFVPDPPPPHVNAALAHQMALYAAAPEERVVHFYRTLEKILPKKLYSTLLPLSQWFTNKWVAWTETPPTPPPERALRLPMIGMRRGRRRSTATVDTAGDDEDDDDDDDDDDDGDGSPTTRDRLTRRSSRFSRSGKSMTIASESGEGDDDDDDDDETETKSSRWGNKTARSSRSRGSRSPSRSPSRSLSKSPTRSERLAMRKKKPKKKKKKKKVTKVEIIVEEEEDIVEEVQPDDDDFVYIDELNRKYVPNFALKKKESEDKMRGTLDPLALLGANNDNNDTRSNAPTMNNNTVTNAVTNNGQTHALSPTVSITAPSTSAKGMTLLSPNEKSGSMKKLQSNKTLLEKSISLKASQSKSGKIDMTKSKSLKILTSVPTLPKIHSKMGGLR